MNYESIKQLRYDEEFKRRCMYTKIVKKIEEAYTDKYLKDHPDDFFDSVIPIFDDDIGYLMGSFMKRISEEKTKIDTDKNPRILIVGDIHGDLKSFMKIVHYGLDDPNCTFVFLGNYINRGNYSVQVFTYIMLLKVVYPYRFYFLRGNHETEYMCEKLSFKKEWQAVYHNYNSFVEIFKRLKNFYTIEDHSQSTNKERYYCVHGCVPKNRFFQYRLWEMSEMKKKSKTFVDDIEVSARRNYFDYNKESEQAIEDFLWSEPFFYPRDYNTKTESKNYTKNGKGHLYGKRVIKDFCEQNKITRIFKGGLPGYSLTPDGRVLNVFSSCDYCGFEPKAYFVEMTLIKSEKRHYDFKMVKIKSLDSDGIEQSTETKIDVSIDSELKENPVISSISSNSSNSYNIISQSNSNYDESYSNSNSDEITTFTSTVTRTSQLQINIIQQQEEVTIEFPSPQKQEFKSVIITTFLESP